MIDTRVWSITPGRCGTRWLARTLQDSPDATVYHEPQPWFPSDWPDHTNPCSAPKRKQRMASCPTKVYGEISCHLSMVVRHMLERGDKAVFLHRNPRDVVTSGLDLGWYTPDDFFRHHAPWRPLMGLGQFVKRPRHERAIWWVNHVLREGLDLLELYPDSLYATDIDALNEPENVERLCDWLGITMPENVPYGYRDHEGNHKTQWNPEWEPLLDRDAITALGYA